MYVVSHHLIINPLADASKRCDLGTSNDSRYFDTLEDAKEIFYREVKTYQHIDELDSCEHFIGMICYVDDFKNEDYGCQAMAMGYYCHLNDDSEMELVEFSVGIEKYKPYKEEDYNKFHNRYKEIKDLDLITDTVDKEEFFKRLNDIKQEYEED